MVPLNGTLLILPWVSVEIPPRHEGSFSFSYFLFLTFFFFWFSFFFHLSILSFFPFLCLAFFGKVSSLGEREREVRRRRREAEEKRNLKVGVERVGVPYEVPGVCFAWGWEPL